MFVPSCIERFKVPPAVISRLAHFGFTNHSPHTACCFVLAPQVQQQLNLAILQLTSTFTKSQSQQYNNGALYIKTCAFKGHGTIRCTAQLLALRQALIDNHSDVAVPFVGSPMRDIDFKREAFT
eukprot:3948548-Karenia_brevis.AAC.1